MHWQQKFRDHCKVNLFTARLIQTKVFFFFFNPIEASRRISKEIFWRLLNFKANLPRLYCKQRLTLLQKFLPLLKAIHESVQMLCSSSFIAVSLVSRLGYVLDFNQALLYHLKTANTKSTTGLISNNTKAEL